ncbi:MAG TPA: DUF4231 domain-containing protein [Solirubrobacterales bacterium]|nr:DUF4231 domain-containing protein [Solirubrobacterales bacterium]
MGAGTPPSDSPAWSRLQHQIAWYSAKSSICQKRFKLLKVCQIVIAAGIPVAVGTPVPTWLVGGAGALIVVLEGLQQLEQYQQNWVNYRSTCEQLKHEHFLFLAGAGPYARASDSERLLAERLESLVSQEHATWVSNQEAQKEANGR